MIKRLKLTNFSAFDRLETEFSSKINVIIGENGTGKTHLLKAAHAVSLGGHLFKVNPEADKDELKTFLTDKLVRLFMPLDDKLGKLRRTGSDPSARTEIDAQFELNEQIQISFSSGSLTVAIQNDSNYRQYVKEPVFIPTKEVLSFMKGFNSLYQRYELSFDQTYQDICLFLDLPVLRSENLNEKSKWAIEEIQKICGGQFVFYGGGNVTFKAGKTEYSANTIAEGIRKLGMLARLLETGAIMPGLGGPLFWDEPESNFNPQIMQLLVRILLELSREGQQIILATHDYFLLKWFDLLMDKDERDHIRFHSLYQDGSGSIAVKSTDSYLDIEPNPIDKTFEELINSDLDRTMGEFGR